MGIVKEAEDIIRSSESLQLKAYKCPAGIWTIGWGHTGGVKSTDVITKEQAEELFQNDIEAKCKAIKPMIKAEINPNQFGALVSFTFNVGEGALKSSTLLRKVNTNPEDPTIKAEFMKWVNAGGKRLAGLVTRRERESTLYFKK